MSTNQVVALKFDVDALKHSMRYAFASDITVIQELIQNARRAGASTVWVNTGTSPSGENTLSVLDNGCGLKDFQVLLQVATSGWGDETKANDRPYGMGFLSAIYGAKHVEVVSLGKVLRLDQAGVLNNGEFAVEDFDGSLPSGAVTSVTMFGLDTLKIQHKLPSIVRGYPIEVVFNGQVLDRPDSLDGTFSKVDVGYIKRTNGVFNPMRIRVYLQGFCVRPQSDGWSTGAHVDTVHLDPTQFYGKFPDRDVVVNEADMLARVSEELKGLYMETLLEARKRLSPSAFMESYHSLAESLGMLKIFNDIDVLPKSFLEQVTSMPHDTDFQHAFMTLGPAGEAFTKAELVSGQVTLAQLDRLMTEDGTDNSKRWIFAYAAGAWVLTKRLDDQHWFHELVTVHEDADVKLEPVGIIRRGLADVMRLEWLGSPVLVLCEDVKVSMGNVSHLLGEPVANESEYSIYITVRDNAPMYVEDAVVQQLNSYRCDDEFHENERDKDVHAVNQMARELASNSPEEQLALSLAAAISAYSKVRSLACTIEIDARGKVKVLSLTRKHDDPLTSSN